MLAGYSRCFWWNVRGTHLELKQEPQCSSPFLTQIARSLHVSTHRLPQAMCHPTSGAVVKQKMSEYSDIQRLPEKRLELAYNRKSVKKRAERVVLGLSTKLLRARAVPERRVQVQNRRRDLNSPTIEEPLKNGLRQRAILGSSIVRRTCTVK